MTLRKILVELKGIRKEIQAIQKSMESHKNNIVSHYKKNLFTEEELNTITRKIRLAPDSVARKVRTEQNGELEGMIVCPTCGKKVLETANFCKYCNAKIKDTCSYCWVKKEDNYNCGESNCPGYGIFRLEKLKSQ